MKKSSFLTLLGLLLLGLVTACGSGSKSDDGASESGAGAAAIQPVSAQADPVQVLETVFAVASGKGEAKLLGELCDPQGENDGDTRRICENAGGFDAGGEFAMFFKEGKVKGPARIQGDRAEVDFVFGPNGDESETMELVRRGEKWYLSDF